MNAPQTFTPAPFALTADEMGELEREEAEYSWREDMAEIAMGCRSVRDGDWTTDDWLEWSPVGRGYAAAHERSVTGMVK